MNIKIGNQGKLRARSVLATFIFGLGCFGAQSFETPMADTPAQPAYVRIAASSASFGFFAATYFAGRGGILVTNNLATQIKSLNTAARLDAPIDPVTTAGIPKSFFGTVAVPFPAISAKAKWDRVRGQGLANAGNCKTSVCKTRIKLIDAKVSEGRNANFARKLEIANSTVNRLIEYKADRANYGAFDHWASARETMVRGSGDCEDFAILKQSMLRAMGVPDKSLSIVILRDNSRNLYHAILGISTNQGNLILDNVRNGVFRDTQVSNYQPLISLSGNRSWIHGTRTGTTVAASNQQAMLTDVAPGESAVFPVLSMSRVPFMHAELRPSIRD